MPEITVAVDKERWVFARRRDLILSLLSGRSADIVFSDDAARVLYLAEVATPVAELITNFFGLVKQDPAQKDGEK